MDPKNAGAGRPPREVRCPSCGGRSLFAASNPWRPFCSERCRDIDLGAWASERYRVEGDAPTDDPEDPPPTRAH